MRYRNRTKQTEQELASLMVTVGYINNQVSELNTTISQQRAVIDANLELLRQRVAAIWVAMEQPLSPLETHWYDSLDEPRKDAIIKAAHDIRAIIGLTTPTAPKVVKTRKVVATASGHKRWTKQDTVMLRTLYKEGLDWTEIAAQLGRTPKACRMHWYNHKKK